MGTRYNLLGEAVKTSTHNLCFEQKYEKMSEFLSETSRFLVAKFSIYLNGRVFVKPIVQLRHDSQKILFSILYTSSLTCKYCIYLFYLAIQ